VVGGGGGATYRSAVFKLDQEVFIPTLCEKSLDILNVRKLKYIRYG
jgi:hypothetical protein